MQRKLIVMALGVTFLAGCHSAAPIEGKWSATVGGQTAKFEFKPDGTATMSNPAGSMTIVATSAYKLDGEKLSLTLQKVEVPGAAAAIKKSLEDASAKGIGKTTESTIKFDGADKASLTLGTVTLPLVRNK